jgi:hypothetical protein
MKQKEEFIEAIKNDEQYEWELREDLILDTDVEFDGTFLPKVLDINNNYTEEEIDNIMHEAGVDDVFEWEELELVEEHIDIYYPYVESCEYETVDESVWE